MFNWLLGRGNTAKPSLKISADKDDKIQPEDELRSGGFEKLFGNWETDFKTSIGFKAYWKKCRTQAAGLSRYKALKMAKCQYEKMPQKERELFRKQALLEESLKKKPGCIPTHKPAKNACGPKKSNAPRKNVNKKKCSAPKKPCKPKTKPKKKACVTNSLKLSDCLKLDDNAYTEPISQLDFNQIGSFSAHPNQYGPAKLKCQNMEWAIKTQNTANCFVKSADELKLSENPGSVLNVDSKQFDLSNI